VPAWHGDAAAYNANLVKMQRQNATAHQNRRHSSPTTEVSGLLQLAFLLLVGTVIRYWHAVHWSVC
jgi:hypothetical protein